MTTQKRYFCLVHGFVVPNDTVVPTCPDCDHPLDVVNATSSRPAP